MPDFIEAQNGQSVRTALDDARAAIERSDRAQRPRQFTLSMATLDETRALRDALRALVRAVETMAEAS